MSRVNKTKFIGFLLVIIVITSVGFFLWNRYILPNLLNIKTFPPALYFVFALFAGILSFFAPCAIGVLPAYVAYYMELDEKSTQHTRTLHAITFGSRAGLGIFMLYFVLGLLLTIFGRTVAHYFSISKPIIALILLIIGLALVRNYSLQSNFLFNFLNTKVIKGNPQRNLFFFGILYGAGALGCSMLVFIPLVIIPISVGKFTTGIIAFVLYSLAFSVTMIITTLLIAFSKQAIIKKITRSQEYVKRITGVILMATALYVFYYWLRTGM